MSINNKHKKELKAHIQGIRDLVDEADSWTDEGDTWSAIQSLEDIARQLDGIKSWFGLSALPKASPVAGGES